MQRALVSNCSPKPYLGLVPERGIQACANSFHDALTQKIHPNITLLPIFTALRVCIDSPGRDRI
jgi:hypothetical protein